MRCSKAKRYIQLSLDDELSAKQQAALNKHLSSCLACRKWQVEAQKLHIMLSYAPETEFPEWIHAQIMDKVQRSDKVRPSFIRRYKLAPATATLAVLISFWAGAQVGMKNYSNTSKTGTEAYTSLATASTSDFGENSLLDSDDYYGENNE